MTPSPRDVRTSSGRMIGREVRTYPLLGSTNDTAAELAGETAGHGLVIVADRQSAGRGQHGRVWQGSAGSSLLCSIIVPPLPALARPAVLTAWAAVGVAGTIRDLTGAEASLKWPNDLLVGSKKVCGILIEQGRGTVVGIGLNVGQSQVEFDRLGLPDATSLNLCGSSDVETATVLDLLLDHLDSAYARLAAGKRDFLEAAWADRIGLLNREVVAERTDCSVIQGRLIALGFEQIVIAPAGGDTVELAPEAIRHLRAA